MLIKNKKHCKQPINKKPRKQLICFALTPLKMTNSPKFHLQNPCRHCERAKQAWQSINHPKTQAQTKIPQNPKKTKPHKSHSKIPPQTTPPSPKFNPKNSSTPQKPNSPKFQWIATPFFKKTARNDEFLVILMNFVILTIFCLAQSPCHTER